MFPKPDSVHTIGCYLHMSDSVYYDVCIFQTWDVHIECKVVPLKLIPVERIVMTMTMTMTMK